MVEHTNELDLLSEHSIEFGLVSGRAYYGCYIFRTNINSEYMTNQAKETIYLILPSDMYLKLAPALIVAFDIVIPL